MSSSAPMQQAKTEALANNAERTMQLAPQSELISATEHADLRTQATSQRQLQKAANHSTQNHQFKTLQQIARGNARASQLKIISAMMNAPSTQRVEDKEALQAKTIESSVQCEATTDATQSPKPNNTGLPDHLKSGIESFSGMSMDHVKVHYNSSQPAQLNAHAYAQGSDIHVAPGQEQHLPHEAWHVVQQAQGRVRPTIQMKMGVPVNDDVGLETEADVMGEKAAGYKTPAAEVSAASSQTMAGTQHALISDNPRVAAQRAHAAHIQSSPHMAAQRHQLGVCQLAPQNVVTTGTTHLVGIRNGSLFDGDEIDGDVVSGTHFTIDADDPIWSRRGPNQEMPGNKRQDREAAQNYAWYPMYSADQSNYVKDGWEHLREETFVKLAVSDSMQAPREGETPSRRTRAAPAAPPEAFDPSNVSRFVAFQQRYQDYLAANYSMQSVMTSHRSVGFEYEFAHHSLSVPAHIVLAHSNPFSNLFPLRFELETDDGSVVEIGMPPFLIPNAEDGGPDKGKLAAVHAAMVKAMEGVRDVGYHTRTTIPELLPVLESGNLGENWQPQASVQGGGLCDDLRLGEKMNGKLKGKVYSQMNISLTGDESARQIQTMQKRFSEAPNFAEKGILGAAYTALEQLAAERMVPLGAVVHLHKAFANMLAIPSILLENSGELTEAPPDVLDLSSAVKELFSVWVKDTVPNVLATTSTNPALLAEYAPAAARLVGEKFVPAVLEPIAELPLRSDGEVASLENIKLRFSNFGCREDYNALQLATANLPDHSGVLLPLAQAACNMMKPGDPSGEFTDQETQDANGGGVQARYDAHLLAFTQALQAGLVLARGRKQALIQRIRHDIVAEMENLLRLMAAPGVVRATPTTFHNETFGGGDGVRKDTYVGQRPGAKAGLRHSVTEIRSDAAMKVFFES